MDDAHHILTIYHIVGHDVRRAKVIDGLTIQKYRDYVDHIRGIYGPVIISIAYFEGFDFKLSR
jgi:hypothetical protein